MVALLGGVWLLGWEGYGWYVGRGMVGRLGGVMLVGGEEYGW